MTDPNADASGDEEQTIINPIADPLVEVRDARRDGASAVAVVGG